MAGSSCRTKTRLATAATGEADFFGAEESAFAPARGGSVPITSVHCHNRTRRAESGLLHPQHGSHVICVCRQPIGRVIGTIIRSAAPFAEIPAAPGPSRERSLRLSLAAPSPA